MSYLSKNLSAAELTPELLPEVLVVLVVLFASIPSACLLLKFFIISASLIEVKKVFPKKTSISPKITIVNIIIFIFIFIVCPASGGA